MRDARSPFRLFPVTLLCTVVIVTLHWKVDQYDRRHPSGKGGLHRYGAASMLNNTIAPELYGHFKLWEGQWWRMLGSGFHHAHWLHVFFNAVGLIFLGALLETRIGSVRMLLFLIVATFVSLVPCFLVEHDVVGLSGGIFAIFGLLVVMRFTNDELKELLPDLLVGLMLLCLPVEIVLREMGVIHISSLAHASGLIYGAFVGLVFYPPGPRFRVGKHWLVFVHLLLVPTVYYITHPGRNARYHWQQSIRADDDERLARLRRAVSLDPGLGGAWLDLANLHWTRGEYKASWRARLQGVRLNPSHKRLRESVNAAWRMSAPQQRAPALAALREEFGEAAADWRYSLGLLTEPRLPPLQPLRRFVQYDEPPNPLRSPPYHFQPDPLFFWPHVDTNLFRTPDHPQTPPPLDPNRPDSALYGTTL